MRRLFVALLSVTSFTGPFTAATVGGLPIHSSAVGSGPTLAFVHRAMCDSSSWDSQVPEPAKKYRVVTLDLPGHGESALPRDGRRAPVIRQYARMFPERVAGLVAVDGPLDMRGFPPPDFGEPPPQGAQGPAGREDMIRSMFVATTSPAIHAHGYRELKELLERIDL